MNVRFSLQVVLNSNYQGPIGIINHDEQRDAKLGLMQEMEGLERVLDSLRNR